MSSNEVCNEFQFDTDVENEIITLMDFIIEKGLNKQINKERLIKLMTPTNETVQSPLPVGKLKKYCQEADKIIFHNEVEKFLQTWKFTDREKEKGPKKHLSKGLSSFIIG